MLDNEVVLHVIVKKKWKKKKTDTLTGSSYKIFMKSTVALHDL